MPHTLRRLFKWLGFIALSGYVILGLVFLGVRYWVLPHIDQWREPLQQQLSAVLPVQVELGQVSAQWRGRHPHVSLRDTRLRDDDGRLLLSIPKLDAVVAWSSLFSGSPRFVALHADGVEVTLRRDEHNRISLVGYEMEAQEDSAAEGGAPLMQWLAQQNQVNFTRARIVWLDELRAAPPLALNGVAFSLGATGDQHVFSVAARPPPTLGTAFVLQGKVSHILQQNQPLSLGRINGLLHVNVEDMRPAGWRPWLDVHSVLEQGQVSWKAWQEVVEGVPGRHVSQVVVGNGVWKPEADVAVMATSAKLHLAGDWGALQQLWPAEGQASEAAEGKARVIVHMQGLAVDAKDRFPQGLVFDQLAVSGEVGRSVARGLHVNIEGAQLRNADMDLEFSGDWQQHGGGIAGVADLAGRFHRAELAAIADYMPAIVNPDARQWLSHGLLEGRLLAAPVHLRGNLEHFPFGQHPEEGDFFLGGQVEGAMIDYAPARGVGNPGWPRLEQLNGHAQLHRVELTIRAESMQMRPGGQQIDLTDVAARIANIERNSVLEVGGTGRAQAPAWLSLMAESPLGRLLEGQFDEAQGQGEWDVPIQLTIPLLNPDATQVSGRVVFHDAELRMGGWLPVLSSLNGQLAFTEEQVLMKGLKGRVLGGPVAITGGMGKGHKALVFSGTLKSDALEGYLGQGGADVLEGATPYRLALRREKTGAYGMTLESSLEGMELKLPAPLHKPSAQSLPLSAQWAPSVGKADASLDIKLGAELQARFLRRPAMGRQTAFFHSGVLNLNGKAQQPAQGLVVDVQAPSVDIDAWREWVGRLGNKSEASGQALFPRLRDLRLQAGQARVLGSHMEHLTFTARQPEGGRWRVDVSSTQTAGTLFWRERRGRIEGEVEAHFERLALGDTSKRGLELESEADELLDEDLDIPAIRLKIDRLSLLGRHVGAFSAMGVNEAQGGNWRLEQMEVASPHGRVKGSGVWRLRGADRGLRLQLHAMFDDLGAWLEQAGLVDLMQGGHGQVQGILEWRNLPWKWERAGLQGDLHIDLAKGRFLHVGSRSARLLELLSLQSVQRLASLNWNPAGLLQQGFPFDTLQGHVRIRDGVAHSENYRVTGPVATIIMAGDVDLPQETLDLYAVVVPNLDVSGAAIAAGIAVNPIVGVGAFLTQWLLKNPMSKAMTVEYRVRGAFDAPRIETVSSAQ